MIHADERLLPPASRLMQTLARRGAHAEAPTLVIGTAAGLVPREVAPLAEARGAQRIVVLSLLGAHPDARAPELRALWDLEEAARATPQPALTLRFGPLIGPNTPLWNRLASRPLSKRHDLLLSPVAEDDALETLAAAFADPRHRSGCYEVAGEPIALGELEALASRVRAPGAGAWEPSLAILAEQRLADPSAWIQDFGITPAPIAARAAAWAA